MQNVKRNFNLSKEFKFMLCYFILTSQNQKLFQKQKLGRDIFIVAMFQKQIPNTNFKFFIFLSKALIENNKTETFK